MNAPTQAQPPSRPRALRLIARLGLLFLVAYAVGRLLNHSASEVGRNAEPAGLGQGLLHGALMPCALPSLLLGRDVTIYAPNNTGRTYKLGYTIGVNACGAVFFGLTFWRLTRWRKQAQAAVLGRN